MPRLELFPFRLRDPVSGRSVRARYVAARHEFEKRYAEWKIVGPAEIRNVEPSAAYFNPQRNGRRPMPRLPYRIIEA
jgi:hypothetical protein